MRCKHCNARLGDHDLWCVTCGKQSSVVMQDLSAVKSLAESWNNYKPYLTKNIPVASVSVLLGFIPIGILVWIFGGFVNPEIQSTSGLFLRLISFAFVSSVFSSIVIMPIAMIVQDPGYHLSKDQFRYSLKRIHVFFGISLLTSIFYILIHVICFGLPSFGSDPILRLAWLVLANYWFAIILPVPILVESQNINPIKALSLSYRHFHDVRWNLYLMALLLILINLAAAAFLVFGLVFTLPFSLYAIRDYTYKLIDFELLEYRR